jgi:type IV secretory pathway VirB3-like protein
MVAGVGLEKLKCACLLLCSILCIFLPSDNFWFTIVVISVHYISFRFA